MKTAKCYDCHGAHDILPVWNPRSHLSRENIVETCAQCHPGSNRRFAGYLTHATHHDQHKYPFLFYAFWGMTALLAGTLSLAGMHTLAWLPRSLQYRKKLKQAHAEDKSKTYVRRFPPFYSKLHLMVIVSFFALALTGMTLKFSYTDWARVMARLFGGFEAAGFIHRVAAVITFAYFALHVFDLIKSKRKAAGGLGKLLLGPNSMLPTLNDFREFVQILRWFIGIGPAAQLRALDLLGEVRLLRRVLGGGDDRHDRAPALVPRVLHPPDPRLGAERGHHHPQRRGPARGRLHLHHPLLQHALPPGEVPHGHR